MGELVNVILKTCSRGPSAPSLAGGERTVASEGALEYVLVCVCVRGCVRLRVRGCVRVRVRGFVSVCVSVCVKRVCQYVY